MEAETLPENPPPADYRSNVDTSRPFRSVKEAVAVFGERFLTGEIYSPSPKPPFTLPKQETPIWKCTPSPQQVPSNQTSWKSASSEEVEPPSSLVNTLKKLESELEETKKELKLLKERESETEVALASLNAELHKNMSKIAKAEAAEAGKAAAARRSSTLGQVLNVGEKEIEGEKRKMERKMMKKKPIIPLVGDLFTRKKGKSSPNSSLLNPLYTSSHMYWN